MYIMRFSFTHLYYIIKKWYYSGNKSEVGGTFILYKNYAFSIKVVFFNVVANVSM